MTEIKSEWKCYKTYHADKKQEEFGIVILIIHIVGLKKKDF